MNGIPISKSDFVSPVDEWLAAFKDQPGDAIDRLLMGRVYMGRLERNETDEILFRLFHNAGKAVKTTLDIGIRAWFEKYLLAAPPSLSANRWALILQNAFSVVIRLNLSQTQTYLLENYISAMTWLRVLYQGPARDPEAHLLRTLALCQRFRDLLPLWLRLCRLEEDRPLDHASIGLLGLLKLPDEQGKPSGDLDPVVFTAIRDLAEAIDRQVTPKKSGKDFWLLQVRAIMARYPRSDRYWTEHFFPLVASDTNNAAARCLGLLIPRLKKAMESHKGIERMPRMFSSPSKHEYDIIVATIKSRSLPEIRPQIDAFLKSHEQYALRSGDADIFVKVLGAISQLIFNDDHYYAASLMEKAFFWAPNNPYNWMRRAQFDSWRGRHEQATRWLWEAKRRFPENPRFRTFLAQELLRLGKNDISEIVSRQAFDEFPQDPVCHTALADVLKSNGKLKEAEVRYRQAIKTFPQDPVCHTGLAELLKAQGKLKEAEDLYRKIIKNFPQNPVCLGGLAEVLKVQGKLKEAEDLYRKIIKDFPDPVSLSGLAEILKASGNLPEAENLYRQVIKGSPHNPFIRTNLAKFLINQGKLKEAEEVYRQAINAFPTIAYFRTGLSEVLESQGKIAEAEQVYHQAIKDLSQEPVIRTNLAKFLINQGKLPEAEEVYRQAMENFPQNPYCCIGLTEVLKAQGKLEEAEEVNRRAIEDLSQDPVYRTGLAETLNTQAKVAQQVGMLNLYRLALRRAKRKDKIRYNQQFTNACNEILADQPNNTLAIQEKGFWLLDHNPEEAASFFYEQLTKGMLNVLGFSLGYLQALIRNGKSVPGKEWENLVDRFSSKRTLIFLERAIEDLHQPNGTTLKALEALRKRISSHLDSLPKALQENEKWLRVSVADRLFANIPRNDPLKEEVLPLVFENYKRHGLVLQGVLEQSIAI